MDKRHIRVKTFVHVIMPELLEAEAPPRHEQVEPEPVVWTSEQRALAEEILMQFRREDR